LGRVDESTLNLLYNTSAPSDANQRKLKQHKKFKTTEHLVFIGVNLGLAI